jgi:hypothetical protein
MAIEDVLITPQKWQDHWEYFRGEPQQVSAIWTLYNHIKQSDPALLAPSAEWLSKWQESSADGNFTPKSPFNFKLTANVTYGELCQQSEARRFTAQHQCNTALVLAQFVQKCRDHFNKPAVITSGHRPPKINAAVGGASRSEHLYDAADTGAIDFYLDGMSPHTLQAYADAHWPYSLGYGANKGFIHIGMRPGKPRVRWDY